MSRGNRAPGRSNEITFTVPLVPPSVNHYVKHTRSGRHYVSKEAKAFEQAVAIFSRGQSVTAEVYQVTCIYYLGHNQRGDIDNYLKCSLDALVSTRVIHSDAAIQKITAEKYRDKENPRTEFTVRAV